MRPAGGESTSLRGLALLGAWLVGFAACSPVAARGRQGGALVEIPGGPSAEAPANPANLATVPVVAPATAAEQPIPPTAVERPAPAADHTATAASPEPAAGTGTRAEGADFDIDVEEQPAGFPDPFERMNRRMFAFNRKLDAWVIAPVSRTYGFLMPRPVKAGVRNFLFNIASPVRLVNDVLQGQWGNAGNTAARFAINTVAGVGGFVDTAKHAGIPPHDADFGQTLAKKGVGSGPFLVVPVLGPTTVRDGFGAIVDTAMNPATYLATPVVSSTLLSAGIGASATGIVEREQHDRDLKRLEEGSTDYYAALRSAYYQNRIAEIGAPGARTGATPADAPETAPSSDAPVAEPAVSPTPGP